MDRQFEQRNDASRQRLRDLVARLDDATLAITVGNGWTVAATLAHLAFWDQSLIVCWNDYLASGALLGIADDVIDVVNVANLPTWLALPGWTAADLALQAAEDADARIRTLPDHAVAHALAPGWRFMLDRSLHRDAHIDEIERSLAG
jgi:hypothetical protein